MTLDNLFSIFTLSLTLFLEVNTPTEECWHKDKKVLEGWQPRMAHLSSAER